jgi:hypothetical protein
MIVPRTACGGALRLGVLVGALGLAVAACGGSSSTSSGAAAPSANPVPPGTTGTIAAVAATSIEVQNPRTGQVTVDFSGSTAITRTATASAADLVVGRCVAVSPATATGGGASTGPVAAGTVMISQSTGQGCRPGAGMGAGMGAGGDGARPSGAPLPSAANGGGNNAARRARGVFGTVSAVSAKGFTVQETSGSAAVTTSASTTYLKTQSADHSALVVGQCATAIGQADDAGTVTATAISVRAPGPNGCAAGVGGGRAQGGGQGGGQRGQGMAGG